MSERLRLDLVLKRDFVASAVLTGQVKILSDGTPWLAPLIHAWRTAGARAGLGLDTNRSGTPASSAERRFGRLELPGPRPRRSGGERHPECNRVDQQGRRTGQAILSGEVRPVPRAGARSPATDDAGTRHRGVGDGHSRHAGSHPGLPKFDIYPSAGPARPRQPRPP